MESSLTLRKYLRIVIVNILVYLLLVGAYYGIFHDLPIFVAIPLGLGSGLFGTLIQLGS